ncbi:MAG: M48 family metalloprotease [Okeania sp. SIO2F4]|uniref:M48 family metalloprotease n=1 Tax=Okeania sp. SIO2F4 TaxID=2607790 RepID=UPI00142A32B8|nr:M48 family metalloprotease [Okeania sp. SIO2F4]NES03097.1 M48 family metalloprotease [Okeania sp. SIO2F4]
MIDKTSSATDNYVPEKPSLKAGLLALKQKDYPQAIAHLEIIAQQESLKQKLKAQMGLVIAYEKTKQVDRAISLCRNLTKIYDSEIQSFAHRHLKELLKRYPPKNLKKSTIPAPKAPESFPQNQQPLKTGFVPFNPTSDKSKSAKNSNDISKQNIDLSVETGFKPIAENTNISEIKSSQNSDYLKHSQSNKNDIEADQNKSPALSSIVNKSNLTNTNQSQKISTEITSDFPKNPSQTSDIEQYAQPNKNHIEADQNQHPALSSIVNKSNLTNTNQSHKTSTEITSDFPKNPSQISDIEQYAQPNKNHIEADQNQHPALSSIVNKSNLTNTNQSHKTSTEITSDFPKNPSQTSDIEQHSQLNKNQQPALSSIVNKPNLTNTNQSHKTSTEITSNFPKNPSQTSDIEQHSQPNKNHIEADQNQPPALSSIVNKSNLKNTKITSDKPENSPKLKWRQAGRAKGGRRLKSANLTILWLEQIIVGIALFWLSLTILKFSLDATNDFLVWLPYFRPIQFFYRDPTRNFIVFLLGLFIFSPWLIDGLLILTYGLQTLPTTTLINYSKEANKLLRTFCKKQKIQGIALKVLPIDVPIAFSYGCLPRFFRIVVSQGLLDNLAEDEIATIYAREISHIQNGDFRLMSMANLMLQIPYTIYWQLTSCADRLLDLINHQLPDFLPGFIKYFLPILVSVFRVFAAIISTLSYGLYWLLKLPILWLSRRRVYYSDRQACNLTGNPNGLTRAILKITIGMANDVESQGKVRHLFESFEILMPVGINQAITTGSVVSNSIFESIFNWDIVNPYRQWLELNNSHPALGDRLKRLSLYANFWKLETELNLGNINADLTAKNKLSPTQEENIDTPPNLDWQKLLLQGTPFFGILIGLISAILLWLIGVISSAIGLWRLDWLFGDISILVACLVMGFSIGILMRINHFFPDIKQTKLWQNPDLAELLTELEALPLDSQIIQFKGKLLGKSGMSNWLGQDLVLKTTKGLVRLHYSNNFGPLGNLWPNIDRPSDFVGKSITVTGWWRRGATPWIDINTLKTENGQSINSDHPLWSIIVAFALAIWGAYMVYTGRF